MRSIWKGAISFGLVTIPVKLYSATEQKDVSFHQVHREDAGRIKYKRVCSIDGEEVPYSEIAKGYELPGGEMVVLTDEDFADLPLSTSRRIDVLQFTPADQLDPILFNKSYYLEPEAAGVKPYILLRDALERTGQVAIVKVALRQRESLAALRIRDGVFVLETMLWPDEVREPGFAFVDEDVEVRPQELQMAESLIDTMAGEFDPTEYHDAYRQALEQVIEAKVAGKELVRPEAAEEAGPAVDLMAALRASVDAAKREREGAKEKVPAGAEKKKAAAKSAGAAESQADEKGEKDSKKQAPKRRARKTA
ncbi:non-homologous end joining protein Ku [Sphaerisporangium perillae]|uniref:non-homologous end joining protein Ku n=1 Tax=Sphaerisporangium perillae TaxID=2935860 RepID=UPI00200F6405|nr:Ku protein [Sphaerisporangium perillae]